MRLEIAVQDVAGVRIAAECGADRVELCAALGATGGLTPSQGLVEGAVSIGLPVHPLIRTRPGGFVYDAEELAVMVRDVRLAVAAGASGVVVGALTPAGQVDTAAVRALVTAAGGAEVTFHRALDATRDIPAALDTLVSLGVGRVLTSGGAPTCAQGLEALADMVTHVAGALQIQAGGGVRIEDLPALVEVGVDAVHLSAKTVVGRDATSGPGGGSAGHEVTDPVLVRAVARALGR